jgi:hypothetical protein
VRGQYHRNEGSISPEYPIILQFMNLGVELEGKAFEICVNIWEKLGKQPSVRYNAFKLMVKIIKKHPELSKELALITESQYMDSLSDTVKRSISKMISKCHYEKT